MQAKFADNVSRRRCLLGQDFRTPQRGPEFCDRSMRMRRLDGIDDPLNFRSGQLPGRGALNQPRRITQRFCERLLVSGRVSRGLPGTDDVVSGDLPTIKGQIVVILGEFARLQISLRRLRAVKAGQQVAGNFGARI